LRNARDPVWEGRLGKRLRTKSLFWKVCAVWGLALGSFAIARPHLFSPRMIILDSGDLPEGSLPAVGDEVHLPKTFTTISDEVIPALGNDGGTIFVVTWAACSACRRGVGNLSEFLLLADEGNLTTRVLVIPGEPDETSWFLDQLPSTARVVLDTLNLGPAVLSTRITPSVVVVKSDGRVSLSGEWPIERETILKSLEQ